MTMIVSNAFVPLMGLIFFLLGYGIGAIPFGLLVTRLAGFADIRQSGSGNIGATNVLRTANKTLAAITLILDVLKGAIPTGLAALFSEATLVPLAAGFGAFLGHLFPVWLRFKGGKGVATAIGVLLVIAWPFALGFCAVWLIIAMTTRYSSVASLGASAITTAALFIAASTIIGFVFMLITALVFWRHQANIARLRAGTESRIRVR